MTWRNLQQSSSIGENSFWANLPLVETGTTPSTLKDWGPLHIWTCYA